MSSFRTNHHRLSLDIVDTYETNELDEDHSVESIPYSKDNIPIGHLASHLETMTANDDSGARTVPPTPIPYYLNSTDMRAMSDTSLFIPDTTSSDGYASDDIPLIPRPNTLSAKSWEDRGAAKIVTTEVDDYGNKITSIVKKSVKDFKFGKSLGEGSYSTVVLATDKITNKNYAIKVLDKRHIIREKKVKYVNIEKNTLNRLGKRNGIIHLYFTFQDEASLYFVLDYAPNGELLSLIKKFGTMNEENVKYYSAQILDGIKYMHDNGVVHRDIKPENILIDSKMTAQITDFGTAKLLEKDENGKYPADVRATSFVGTAEYVSPELLNDKYCGKACDIWAFGCIIYQMIAGKPPFKATNEYLTFQKVCKLQYAFTAGFPLIIRDLIKKILVINPNNRATIRNIQDHYFFSDIDWSNHEALFETAPPELGPYKITAKSMMPIPELSQQTLARPKVRKPQKSANSVAPTTPKLGYDESDTTQHISYSAPTTPALVESSPTVKTPNRSKPKRSASSAAAAALLKTTTSELIAGPNDSTDSELAAPYSAMSSSTSSKRGSDLDLYIPGTNILRPVVKSRVISTTVTKNNNNASRSNNNSKVVQLNSRRLSDKPAPIPAMTSIDLAWVKYLKHPNERVSKIGHVLVSQTTTDLFEKKYRGMLAESPLGYLNGRKFNNSSNSLLTQIANGQHPGLRRGTSTQAHEHAVPAGEVGKDELDAAIVFNAMDDELEKKKETEKEKPEKSKFKKVFSGFGSSNSSNNAAVNANLPKDRTLLITTFGRALIFILKKDKYELRTEIDLTNSAVKFKEVIGDRRSRSMAGGIFAIESSRVTLLFEVEKLDVTMWTTALAKSKEMEEERVLRESIEADMGSVTNASNALTAAAIATLSSPKMESLQFSDKDVKNLQLSPKLSDMTQQIKNYDMVTLNRIVKATKSPRSSTEEHRHRSHQTKVSETKQQLRKPPPPPLQSKKSTKTKNGETKENHDNHMIAAVINTAMHNPDIKPTTVNRTSSFTRGGGYFHSLGDSNGAHEPETRPIPRSPPMNSSTGNGHSKNMITSINSKFLARSHRKK